MAQTTKGPGDGASLANSAVDVPEAAESNVGCTMARGRSPLTAIAVAFAALLLGRRRRPSSYFSHDGGRRRPLETRGHPEIQQEFLTKS